MKYPASFFVVIMFLAIVIGSIADGVAKGTGIIAFIAVIATVVVAGECLHNLKRKNDSIEAAQNVLAEAKKQSLEKTKFLKFSEEGP